MKENNELWTKSTTEELVKTATSKNELEEPEYYLKMSKHNRIFKRLHY